VRLLYHNGVKHVSEIIVSCGMMHLLEKVDHLDDFVAILIHVCLRFPHHVDQLCEREKILKVKLSK
jgi:hypothetical protein